MSRTAALAALAACSGQLLVLLTRGGGAEARFEDPLAWGVSLLAVGVLVRRFVSAQSSHALTSIARTLAVACLPAAVLAGRATLHASTASVAAGSFLRLLTSQLEPPMLEVASGTRASSAILAAVATIAAFSAVDPVGRRALLGLQICAATCAIALPSLGGGWLFLLIPAALVGSRRPSSALIGVAFGGAVTMWMLSDHASLWADSVYHLDETSSRRAGAPELLTAPAAAAFRMGTPYLLLAWAPSLGHLLRGRGGGALLVVVMASLVPLAAFNSSRWALTRASVDSQSPLPELTIAEGGLVVGGARNDSCIWTPRRRDTLRIPFSRESCEAMEIVGLGPTMRFHGRLSGLGPPFDLPMARAVAIVRVELVREGEAVDVPRTPADGVDYRLRRLLAQAPHEFTGRPFVLRLSPDTPAAEALALIEALWARRVSVGLRIPDAT